VRVNVGPHQSASRPSIPVPVKNIRDESLPE